MPHFLWVLRNSHGSPELSDRSQVCFSSYLGPSDLLLINTYDDWGYVDLKVGI